MHDMIRDLQDLFDMAWDINNSGNGTDLSRKITTVLPGALQDLQAAVAYADLCHGCASDLAEFMAAKNISSE